jgi:hypothetical protein
MKRPGKEYEQLLIEGGNQQDSGIWDTFTGYIAVYTPRSINIIFFEDFGRKNAMMKPPPKQFTYFHWQVGIYTKDFSRL